jgi:hypothetical protein
VKLTVRWSELPSAVRSHLIERVTDRSITTDDLRKLQFWFELSPDVPDGDWYKDFGSFKLAGRGSLVLTFLSPEQIPWGTPIADSGTEG